MVQYNFLLFYEEFLLIMNNGLVLAFVNSLSGVGADKYRTIFILSYNTI